MTSITCFLHLIPEMYSVITVLAADLFVSHHFSSTHNDAVSITLSVPR